jgi:type IX secretion system substrate protein
MKQLYSGALVVLTLSFFSFSSSAQSGGVYTAVQPGNWHTTSGPGIWQTVEPPQNCVNCQIIINVNGGVNLNTTVTLSSTSQLILGGTGNATTLSIGNSNASDFADSYSLILLNDGTDTKLIMENGNAILNAATAGVYDGFFTSFISGGSTVYFKQVGNAPSGFSGNTVESNSPAPDGKILVGPLNLNAQGTLPIILGNFSAVVDNGAVDLAWTTDMEVNSDHFGVQSSSNAGASWNTIGTVAAAGSSASVSDYSFVDGHPAQGTSEYRLVLVDRNGNTAYSPVKAVRIGSMSSVSVYPNPASDYVNVTLSGDASVSANIRLVNLSGQVLMEKTVTNAGGTTVPLTVSSYPAGNYLIVITGSDGSKQVNKILIAR